MEAGCDMIMQEVQRMETKEQLLALLEHQKGSFVSGEEIAERLAVSRAAVWKAVNSLRTAGYPIEAVRNRGYCLSGRSDILSKQGIAKYLSPACQSLDIQVVPEAGSTNTSVRQMAASGAPEGAVLLSGCQTQGRGRLGRTFFSPPDTGVYLSLLLRPAQCRAQDAVRLTTMAAVAVCEAIEAVSGAQAQIKWVNDIFMHGRKVCGILTEAALGLEDGCLEYAVLGIGLNVYPPQAGFPEDLQSVAGAVFSDRQDDGKNRLVAAFLNGFWNIYRQPGDYAARYRARSLVIGREIEVLRAGQQCPARALDVDNDCRLHVQYADGTTDCLSAGEITIRME